MENPPLPRTALVDGSSLLSAHLSPALVLPEDRHPSRKLVWISKHPFPDCLLNKTQKTAIWCIIASLVQACNPTCGVPAKGLSFPPSSRSARVQRAARSRLCVTSIDVRP
jgi:hypothetical protein